MTEFEKIYRTYFRDVERYLLTLCRDPQLAEELTAQTFFRAMEALPQFRDQCDIRTWLCAIGKNRYLDYLRRNRKQVSLEEMEAVAQTGGVEEQILDRSQAMSVHRALHTLPEPYKEVFSLRVFGQLSFGEIGSIFGKSQNWACVTYHRAKQKIQEALEVQK